MTDEYYYTDDSPIARRVLCYIQRQHWYEDFPPRCTLPKGHTGPHRANKHWGVAREEIWDDEAD